MGIDRQFVEHLISKGLVTRRDYSKAVRVAESINLPIGSMACQRGLLAYNDIARIIDYQVDHDLLFGEAAVAMGLMTSEQVEAVLAAQRKLHVSVYDVLASTAGLSKDRLKTEYKLFLKAQISKDTEALDF